MKYRKHGRFSKSTNAFVRCGRCNKFTKLNAIGNNYDLKCVQCKCYEKKQPSKEQSVEMLVFDDKNSIESGVVMNHSLKERVEVDMEQNLETDFIEYVSDIIVETVFSNDDAESMIDVDENSISTIIEGIENESFTNEDVEMGSSSDGIENVDEANIVGDNSMAGDINAATFVENNTGYCVNCKRWCTIYSNEDVEFKKLYELQINECIVKKASLRRKFCTVTMQDIGTYFVRHTQDSIKMKLCKQCNIYLTAITNRNKIFKESTWPVIFWKLISSNVLYEKHSYNLWRIVPLQWQQWWIRSLRLLLPQTMYPSFKISNIIPAIVDISIKKNNLEKSINDGILGNIISNCDDHLLPLIKCPWGCTEYYHLCGKICIESVFLKFVGKEECENFMSVCDREKAATITRSCRNDYLCIETDSNELLLWNPKWRVVPSISFINNVPVFLTCRMHNNGSKKNYLHPPKNPFGTLPSSISDQVAAAVVVPRTLRATKAHKYSHSFNLQEMRCQFNGVDTMSVTDKPVFNSDNILSTLYDSLAIKGREDVRSYVANLSTCNKYVAINLSKSLLDRSSDIIKNDSVTEHFGTGCSFISVKDALQLQKDVKHGRTETIIITNVNGDEKQYHYTSKWPKSLFFIHNIDEHGATFSNVPKPSDDHCYDTRILWLVQMLHAVVPEVWENTANNISRTSEWNGWLLLYTTECCFPYLLKNNTRQRIFSWNKIKNKHDKERKIFGHMGIGDGFIKDNYHESTIRTSVNMDININEDNDSNESVNSISIHNESHRSDSISGEFSIDEYETEYNYLNTDNIVIDNFDIVDERPENDDNVDDSISDNYDIAEELPETEEMLDDLIDTNELERNDSVVGGSEVNFADISRSLKYTKFDVSYLKFLFSQAGRIAVLQTGEDWNIYTSNQNIDVLFFVNTNNNTETESVISETSNNNNNLLESDETDTIDRRNLENSDSNIVNNLHINDEERVNISNDDVTNDEATDNRNGNDNRNDRIYEFIPIEMVNNDLWEIRCLCFTLDSLSFNINKWKGNVYCRHGNDTFSKWWKLSSEQKVTKKMETSFDVLDVNESIEGKCNIAVFVRKNTDVLKSYRDTFLKTIGGQSDFICKVHQVPLVVCIGETNICCTYIESIGDANETCKRKKAFASCPIPCCSSCVCNYHFKNVKRGNQGTIEISPSEKNVSEIPLTTSDASMNIIPEINNLHLCKNDEATEYFMEPQFGYEFDDDSSKASEDDEASIENKNNNDLEMNADEEDGPSDLNTSIDASLVTTGRLDNEFCIPCSSAGTAGGMYLSEDTKQTFVGAHVILNNCGMLLARRGKKLSGTKIQQRFLQSIVAQNTGKSVPLLYPEALLFPSIFWKENKFDSSPVGAIPSCLLAQDSTLSNNGFASLLEHFRSRITNTSLLTSTDPRYITFCFDNYLNLQSRHTHTRLILHRGLWNSGLGKSIGTSKESLFNVDSIESRPVVNKLAAAVAEEQATYFYTHTCNQAEHFGIRRIKHWIDSIELENIILSKLSNIEGLTQHIERYVDQIKTAIIQSSAVIMLRNWMEVSTIWMNYIKNSPEKPLGKVERIWWRHEYQDSKGNLSHIHALIWVDRNEDIKQTLDRIRGSTLDLITDDELETLIQEKILDENDSSAKVRETALKLLRHVCTERCKRRTGVNKNDVKCRVTNNGLENPTPNKHCFKEYDVEYSNTCVQILADLDLMTFNDATKRYIIHSSLKAIKHYPPAVGGEGNISPCNGKLFAACLSNNNLKYVTSYLASRYLAKYVASVDENNRVYLSTNPKDASEIKAKMEFLHNTKITSSAMNEKKKHELSRNKHKPQGRAISLMEIIATLLGYPQVYTDINFIHIPTIPLAERSAIEKTPAINKIGICKQFTTIQKIDDFDAGDIVPQFYIRNIKLKDSLPLWRQYTEFESLMMKDQMFSNLSIDNVTLFGLRPPELRFVRSVKLYFQCFYFEKLPSWPKTFSEQVEYLEKIITEDVTSTMWINGIGHKILVRPRAINLLTQYIRNSSEDDFYGSGQNVIANEETSSGGKYSMLSIFKDMEQLIQSRFVYHIIPEPFIMLCSYYLGVTTISSLISKMHECLPVIWFSSIKPSHGSRWLLHLLISMGQFENEYDLYCKENTKQCFIACKLLSGNSNNNYEDVRKLARKYILEQLNYIPGGSKQFDRNVIAAYQTLKSLLALDCPVALEMPPILYTQLQECVDKQCKDYLNSAKKTLLQITVQKISSKASITLPLLDELMNVSKQKPLMWHPTRNSLRGVTQSEESYSEQLSVLDYGCSRLQMFLSGSFIWNQNIIICGGPGVGKTTLLQLLIIYAASNGLNINLSSVMSERSIELGGMHLSKMFCIPTDKKKSPSLISEKAVCSLLRNPKQFTMLQKLEVLAIDEFGQVSAELLSVIDIILRTIRRNSLFMGGVYVIGTMDNMQLPPVNGRPPLLSPHMLSSFTFRVLTSSVRASQDADLQEIQRITRMSYNELTAKDIERFRYLIENCCTFVKDFNDSIITTDKLRVFGKRSAKVLAEETLLQMKRKQHGNELIECKAEDFESTIESQWAIASPTTSRLLSQRVKEPLKLCFYPFAAYEITFNCGNRFSQGQIAVLAEMPSIQQVQEFSPVSLYVAPDGCKIFPTVVDIPSLKSQGWRPVQMSKCREHPEYLSHRVQAKRRQYGLRHRYASTIHATMGQDLEYIVTKVTDRNGDPNYHLWDKEQVVVLLSRTNFAKNIIFVGDKCATSKALSELLNKRSQYTEYTNLMLSTLSKGICDTSALSVMNMELYPFRIIDFEIPTNSSGYVYLIQSRNQHMSFPTYIGETNNIVRRIREHNQLRGSHSTRNTLLLPWALICFITGFCNGSKINRQRLELLWKIERDNLKKSLKRPLTVKEMCGIANTLITQSKEENLRLIVCCIFD